MTVARPLPPQTLAATVVRHDVRWGLTVLSMGGVDLRVPQIDAAPGTELALQIDPRDVAVALTRPMDVSITNRLPGQIVGIELLDLPYARVRLALDGVVLDALLTQESVDRLALEEGLSAWAMIKAVALASA